MNIIYILQSGSPYRAYNKFVYTDVKPCCYKYVELLLENKFASLEAWHNGKMIAVYEKLNPNYKEVKKDITSQIYEYKKMEES